MHRTGAGRAQRGAGLVELMVGLTIGLVILMYVTGIFLSGTQIGNSQTEQARLQESARLAMQLMGISIRQSGYNHNILLPLDYTPMEGTMGANAASADQLTLRRHAATGSGGASEQDCTGQSVTAGTVIQERYYLAAAGSSARARTSLFCSNATSAVELVPGVVNMKFSFGLDADQNGAIDSAYVSSPSNYADVAVVRVELTLAGEAQTGFTRPTGTKYCDSYANNACLTFTNSFLLRNRVP